MVGKGPDGAADKYQLPHLPAVLGLLESVDQVSLLSCYLVLWCANLDAINSLTSGEVISYSEVRFLTCE